jgi:hypothetical protein
MIHQPMGGFQGQASDIAIQAKEILRMKDALNSILEKPHRQGYEPDPEGYGPRLFSCRAKRLKNTASWTMSFATGMTWII